jgi:hypothetical protein
LKRIWWLFRRRFSIKGEGMKPALQLQLNKTKEETMGELVHTSRIKIVREKGPTRRAMIEGFNEPIYYGVHGGIKSFYKVEPEKEHAATLDHIVAATAG